MSTPPLMYVFTLLASLTTLNACSTMSSDDQRAAQAMNTQTGPSSEPPQRIREWMNRLTVAHEYDPRTGFIVAREIIDLPPVIASSPAADIALGSSDSNTRLVVVFATADRCAPCQQYKKTALNDPTVIEALNRPDLLATHIEVDQDPALADSVLGSRAIPMTYLFRGGKQVAVLRGQRSPTELLTWLDTYATP